MDNNVNNEKTPSWKSGAKPLPEPTEIKHINKDALFVKKKDKEE